MKEPPMKRWVMQCLIMLNALLAVVVFVEPARTAFMSKNMKDCCQESVGESRPYCCFECCWFVDDCDSNEDCESVALP